jgi:ferric-dicitrate binding protein FerR (iron transport regulator)/tetratricopeptide (TPR) repeat protein
MRPHDIGDENVERLLGSAYRPENPDPAFLTQLNDRLQQVATELAARRNGTWQHHACRDWAWLRRRVGWALVAAAAIVGMPVALALLESPPRGDGRREAPETVELAPAADGAPWAGTATQGLTASPRPPSPAVATATVGADLTTKPGERKLVKLADGSALYLNSDTRIRYLAEREVKLVRGEVYVEVAPRTREGRKVTFLVHAPGREVAALGTRFRVWSAGSSSGVGVTQGAVQVSRGDRALQGTARVESGQQLAPEEAVVSESPRASHVLDWARELMIAADSPLVPCSEHAGGALIAKDPKGEEANLSLRDYHVDVHIEDGFARTTIDQTYFNDSYSRLEGTFYFPLPADAQLSRLAMYVKQGQVNVLMEGGMAEREHARTVFETIRYMRRDPALLEWVDGSTFKMRVFPLEAREEKRIILSYTQKLGSVNGLTRYRFPAGHNLKLVNLWSFEARVKNGASLVCTSSSHPDLIIGPQADDMVVNATPRPAVLDRDVVLEIRKRAAPTDDAAQFSSFAHEGDQYLMLRYRPRLDNQRVRERRDWVILYETSGDRDPLLARAQIEIIRRVLESAEHDDTFTLAAAGTRTVLFDARARQTTPGNIKEAMAFLEGMQLIGALDLAQALKAVDPLLSSAQNPYLLHVGSGIAVLGERQDDVLVKMMPFWSKYVGVGVGKRWNRSFMKLAAERTGGYFTQINPDEPLGWRSFELMAALNTPRLLDVRVTDDAGECRFLTDATTICQGEEIVAVARVDGQGALPRSASVTGRLGGKSFIKTFKIGNIAQNAGYLPRFWAKLEIDRLLADGAEKNKARIIKLSMASYVMSPYTSLLVLETDADYATYKVDRGRKDHWAMYKLPPTMTVGAAKQKPDPAVVAEEPKKMKTEEVVESVLGPWRVGNTLNFILTKKGTFGMPEYTNLYANLATQAGVGSNYSSFGGTNNKITLTAYGTKITVDTGALPGASARDPLPLGNFLNELKANWRDIYGPRVSVQITPSPQLGVAAVSGTVRDPQLDALVGGGQPFGGFKAPGIGSAGFAGKGSGGFGPGGGGAGGGGGWGGSTNNSTSLVMGGSSAGSATVGTSGRGGKSVTLNPFGEAAFSGGYAGGGYGAYGGVYGGGYGAYGGGGGYGAYGGGYGGGYAGGGYGAYGGGGGYGGYGLSGSGYGLMGGGLGGIGGKYGNVGSVPPYTLGYYSNPYQYVVPNDAMQGAPSDGRNPSVPQFGAGKPGPGKAGAKVAGLIASQPQIAQGEQPPDPTDWIDQFIGSLVVQQGAFTPPNDDSATVAARVFGDLTAFAPGMQSNLLDLLAVLDAEKLLGEKLAPGAIDPKARKLLDRARAGGWRKLEIKAIGEQTAFTIHFSPAGAFVWDRVLASGLREKVVCDGSHIWHLYPEIGLGARRPWSRFLQAEMRSHLPWLVPSAEELAQDGDVIVEDRQIVAVRPRGAGNRAPFAQLNLIFDEDGRLAEKQTVIMPAKTVIVRETYAPNGAITVEAVGDKNGSSTIELKTTPTAAPSLKPQVSGLVIVPMPLRSPEYWTKMVGEYQLRHLPESEPDETVIGMIASHAVAQRGQTALELFGQRFHQHGDNRLGFYTLMAASGYPVQPTFVWRPREFVFGTEHFDVAGEHPQSPLARYLARHFEELRNDVKDALARHFEELRNGVKGASAKATPTTAGNGLIARLDRTRGILRPWQELAAVPASREQKAKLLNDTLPWIGKSPALELDYALLAGVLQAGYAGKEVASALQCWARRPGVEPNQVIGARIVLAVNAVRSGKIAEGRKQLDQICAEFTKAERPLGILAVARKIHWRGETALAGEYFELAAKTAGPEEDLAHLAAAVFYVQNQDLRRAESHLRPVLEKSPYDQSARLWRWGSAVAARLKLNGLAVARLEKALDLEFRAKHDVVDVQAVRTDYAQLLSSYLQAAEGLAIVNEPVPPSLLAKIIRAADRWRALDPDPTEACQLASKILRGCARSDLAWDYLTTPLSLKPASAAAWLDMARALQSDHQLDLADNAFAQAYAAEPTNAQILWDRAENLENQGRTREARGLFETLATREWQQRFQPLGEAAKRKLGAR